MKLVRRSVQSHLTSPRPVTARDIYFFYEKNTGVSHFHIEADSEGRFPVDQAAGLLAMHCVVRGQSPNDYVVMVQANTEILEDLKEKAEKLLEAGQSVNSNIKLTRREEEVLGGIMRSLANKEIASSLNLSERTVKFHVSSLLAKFGVKGRLELVREATRRTANPLPVTMPVTTPRNFIATPQVLSKAARGEVLPLSKGEWMA